MRIGILTFPHTTNYGATLQAYALRQQITRLGHDCGVLDYRNRRAMRLYIGLSRSRHFAQIFWRKRRFSAFERREFAFIGPPAHDSDSLASLTESLDAVVVGSDQVWDLTSFRGWCPEMYLGFVHEGCARIAYAPSCGMTVESGEHAEHISRELVRFTHLSARDRNTADFVRAHTGRDATLVLDPTFLGDFDDVTPDTRPVREPYLLVYAGLSGACVPFVHEIARRLNLRVVSVGYAFPGAIRVITQAGPREFLACYRSASYVVTSFFHGTIFAVLNRKPFVTFLKKDKTMKVPDLLDRSGLSDRQFEADAPPPRPAESLLEIDYSGAEPALEHEISVSRAYLEEALRAQ